MASGGKRIGAGRPKGSLSHLTERAKALLEELDFDPLRELVALYRDSKTDRRTRVRIASELAQFVAPKLKAVDIQTQGETELIIQLVQFNREERIVEIDEHSPLAHQLLPPGTPLPGA